MANILSVLNSIWPYAVAVLLFIILIVVHELGHFTAAKAVKVKVNEFAVGFGPKLFGKTLGETQYRVNAVPLGGYCAMEGEDDESDNPRAFCNAKAWKRLIIIISGALFNLIFGLLVVALVLTQEDMFSSTRVAKFADNAVSGQSGLEVGDEIIRVDGRRVYTAYDLSYTFTNVDGNSVDLTVKRGGEKTVLKDVAFQTKQVEGTNVLLVDFWVQGIPKTFSSFVSQAFKTTVSYGRIVWLSLIDLITGKYGMSAVSGPVGLTKAIGTAAKSGLTNLLPILALITVNLGIFNLLPLPALDGGRLLFIIIEMIFRRPVPRKFEGLVHAAGFVILIGFMLIVTAKDIWVLIAG